MQVLNDWVGLIRKKYCISKSNLCKRLTYNYQNLLSVIWGNLEYKIIKKEKIVSNILMEGNGSEIRKKEMEKGKRND